ncbi:secreted RxLR effector protein 161-like [Salvia splendens]|uniref:secreted RxLR effector protein 161-like n=1 Tax=Salvia splendens TaxID=180675 RepID=UPI001C263C1D|nr:secreted RxLR effector protein 161-like [Salvia splendens]
MEELEDINYPRDPTAKFHQRGLLDCKSVETPILVNHGLQISEDTELANQGKYQRLVRKLIYLSHTRPDIAYAVGIVSQFMHRPHKDHYEAALRIVKYLNRAVRHRIMFKKNEQRGVYGYTDADWASNPVDRRSTTGYFTFVEGNLVTWRTIKQKVVALSSAEVEFIVIKSGLMEILWLRRLMKEIGLAPDKSHIFVTIKRQSVSLRIQCNMC